MSLPPIPEAEFSPPWHQYFVIQQERLESRLALIESVVGIEDGGTPDASPQGILLQGLPPAIGLSTLTNITTAVEVSQQVMACLKADSRVIVRGCVNFVPTSTSSTVNGINVYLYVNGINSGISPIPQQRLGAQVQSLPFSFDYSPGDTDRHAYSIWLEASAVVTCNDKERWMQCEEWSTS